MEQIFPLNIYYIHFSLSLPLNHLKLIEKISFETRWKIIQYISFGTSFS